MSQALSPVTRQVIGSLPKTEAGRRLGRMLRSRDAIGWESYGKPLSPEDGRDFKEESLEELLDALQYLTAQSMRNGGRPLRLHCAFRYALEAALLLAE